MRDAGFKHLAFAEIDDHQATQKLKQRETRANNIAVAEGGIIESITCYNFMCHERLHVELGPLINFIVGENGSGKSAVLTALTLCLGGKASDTNRGGSLKSFVKEGTEKGSLVVRIKNAGSDAYQPEIYGDTIIVERNFSKNGTSGFKIKSSAGLVVASTKQEVDEITEWYAMQIGNPLVVLTQDNARQFLNSASPAQKYKYFVMSVQLEQLDHDYKMVQDMLDKTLVLRDDLEERIKSMKKESDAAIRLAETATQNESLREKKRHYRNQLVWSQVTDQERELQACENGLAQRNQAVEAAQTACQAQANALDTVEKKVEDAKHERADLDTEQVTHQNLVDQAQMEYDEAKRKTAGLMQDERDAHLRLKTAKEEVRILHGKIQEEEKRLDSANGSERAETEAQLAEAKTRVSRLTVDLKDNAQQQLTLQNQHEEARSDVKRQQQAKELKRNEVLTAEQRVRELENSTPSPNDGYDPEITSLATALQRDDSFQHKPIGPIGLHIRLRKPEWTGILEKTFGDALNGFIVRNKPDQTRLANMMRQRRMKKPPQIFVAYCEDIDTNNQEPSRDLETILSVLEFEEKIVRTQMIINFQIEKIILVPERLAAQQLMFVDSPPRNVTACLCFHDGRHKRGHGLRLTNRAGTWGTGPVTPSAQRPRMRTDSAEQIKIFRDNLEQLGSELRELNGEERQALALQQRCQREVAKNLEGKKRLDNELRHAQSDVMTISEEADKFEGVDDRLMALRRDLDDKRAEELQVGNQYGHLAVSKQEVLDAQKELKTRLEKVKLAQEDHYSRIHKADQKIASKESLRKLIVGRKNEAFEALDIARNERQRAADKRDEQHARVEDFTRKAEELHHERVHVPEDETYQSVQVKYQKVVDQLEQRRKRLGATDAEIQDRATNARLRYTNVKAESENNDSFIELLKKTVEARLERWRRFQRQISARIRIQFNYLLSERGFRGKIDLDHRARKVELHIEPDETRKSSTGRNTKTLSGGEKSFSSICMLLSIWEAIGSPIRCLDEFDVFMDNVNRAISTNMLVSATLPERSRMTDHT